MAGHSVAIDFWVEALKIKNPVERETLLQNFIPIVQPHSGSLTKITDVSIPGGHYIYIFASKSMTLSIKMYKEGLVTTTLEYIVDEESIQEHKIMIDHGRGIEKKLAANCGAIRARVLPAVKRAPPINLYFSSSDDRILEYDVDDIIFEEKSDFQKVQVYATKSYGNILVLDDLQNLGESDIEYTHGLMNKEEEDYGGKQILILGGGDGGLLWELLKQNPAFVTMIDIDEVVIKACRKHLRSVCGNCLDNYDGKNYKIIIGDALAYMKDYLKEKRKFDYVIGDLTDIPISETPRGELWDFMREILNLGIQLLKPSGKYMTHAIGIQCESALKMFEEQINNLVLPVTYTTSSAHVPSFMEKWCFYQISLKNS